MTGTFAPRTPAGRNMLRQLRKDTQRCIRDYRLLSKPRPLVLGLSGGKDSTLAAVLLTQLGYDVRPAVVDLHYEHFDAEGIAAAARSVGLAAEILTPEPSSQLVQLLPGRQRQQLRTNLTFLKDPGDQTPCGPCSQTKRLLLKQYADQIDAPSIVLAHHRTDFATTILKDYFLHRYLERNNLYSRSQFIGFIASHAFDERVLRGLVAARLAAGMALRTRVSADVDVVRPLAYLSESDISYLVHDELALPTFGSGCSHSSFLRGDDSHATKRELVHAELRRRATTLPSLEPTLFKYALTALDDTGRLRFNPRAKRGTLQEAPA